MHVSSKILVALLVTILASCDDASLEKARTEALRREAVALIRTRRMSSRRKFAMRRRQRGALPCFAPKEPLASQCGGWGGMQSGGGEGRGDG
jgi:hypothetical protein